MPRNLLTRIAATAATLTCLSVTAPGIGLAQASATTPTWQNADLMVSAKYAGSGAGQAAGQPGGPDPAGFSLSVPSGMLIGCNWPR